MSSPRVIVQIAIAGAKIFGKAFYAAGKQAIANAKYRPPGTAGGDVAGIGNATSGSITDRLTREHRMTLDEARLILNVKDKDPVERIVQNYEHLFKQNSPPPPPEKAVPKSSKQAAPAYSHYLQSKVVRAKERLDAELKASLEGETPSPPPPEALSSNPPPPAS
ncbi:hypothetical protein DICSQDRAFT_144130 [Dichomitus squalens LYAD-421 SS1]|uniref:Mitochondrial import inner membrane translocase subunit TIM16 n=1 Tax=Dichomitus squalens TaxID=114155 RepID=A0A4Q9MZV8_9APHY|nr:uncharacterized protein DICSQDRAFT_144130 [Dichomitus squalens LYAD-421 SS1]EJF65481.1 hypothetical protein DICSQDRAFT_144130 [Dichomitus squalens LYAD-421 SS1]TBU33679.1 hypothetical protein BD311DRAFT_774190 [Dichomitus squalens]